MCVSSFGIATWARYRSTQGGNVTAQIAKWSFKVNKATSLIVSDIKNSSDISEGL